MKDRIIETLELHRESLREVREEIARKTVSRTRQCMAEPMLLDGPSGKIAITTDTYRVHFFAPGTIETDETPNAEDRISEGLLQNVSRIIALPRKEGQRIADPKKWADEIEAKCGGLVDGMRYETCDACVGDGETTCSHCDQTRECEKCDGNGRVGIRTPWNKELKDGGAVLVVIDGVPYAPQYVHDMLRFAEKCGTYVRIANGAKKHEIDGNLGDVDADGTWLLFGFGAMEDVHLIAPLRRSALTDVVQKMHVITE